MLSGAACGGWAVWSDCLPASQAQRPDVGGIELHAIVAALGGELIAAPAAAALRIERIGAIEDADASTITFLSNPRLRRELESSRAGCVIVAPALRDAAMRRGA